MTLRQFWRRPGMNEGTYRWSLWAFLMMVRHPRYWWQDRFWTPYWFKGTRREWRDERRGPQPDTLREKVANEVLTALEAAIGTQREANRVCRETADRILAIVEADAALAALKEETK